MSNNAFISRRTYYVAIYERLLDDEADRETRGYLRHQAYQPGTTSTATEPRWQRTLARIDG